jgi:hypothetical protein
MSKEAAVTSKETSKEASKEIGALDKLQHIEKEINKFKNGIDYLNTSLIRANGLQEKMISLESKFSELDKIPTLIELTEKLIKKVDKLDKNLAEALKNIHDNNESGNKVIRGQLKKLSESLNQYFILKVWKLPQVNVLSLIFILLLALTGYLSLLHFFF